MIFKKKSIKNERICIRILLKIAIEGKKRRTKDQKRKEQETKTMDERSNEKCPELFCVNDTKEMLNL